MRGGEIFWDDEISVSKFRFLPQMFGGGILVIGSNPPPPNGSCAQSCDRHSCRRWVQALVRMLYQAPSMGFCSQFGLILHPHRVAVPFPPTFATPWRNILLQIHAEQICCRQNLGSPLKNDPKTTQIGWWGHLMVQINPPPEAVVSLWKWCIGISRTHSSSNSTRHWQRKSHSTRNYLSDYHRE